jgi:hypothetical protein
MAPQPQFYDSTDTSQISGTIAANVNAGATFAAVVYHLWNDKGGSLGATDLADGHLRAVVKDGSSYVTSGHPALDEAWLQARVTGADKTGDSTMEDQAIAWTPIGANRTLALADIPANCARYIEVKIVVPAGQANVTQELHLEVVYNQTSVVLPFRLTVLSGSGIIADRLDTNIRRLKSGRGLTAAGTEVVTIAAGEFTFDGYVGFRMSETVTLNQTAADGALGVGQSYIAVISQPGTFANGAASGAATATKGNKGASPTAPAVPTDHILLGYVTVTYQGGGTSVINTANLDMANVRYGEYLVTAGTGLNVKVWPGSALSAADSQPSHTAPDTIAIDPSVTRYVWLNPDGTFTVQADGPGNAPSAGSQLLASVTTGVASVTSITDYRAFTDHVLTEYIVELRYDGPLGLTSSGVLKWTEIPYDMVLDRYRVGTNTALSGSTTKVDILWGSQFAGVGTSIFDFSVTDLRPIATASVLNTPIAVEAANHIYRNFPRYSRFGFSIVAGSDNQADLIVQLFFRKGYGK